ncbi:MAG: RagB/SusD family nutrient uptake outer membrane protein [Bacteroidales bacterium]|nr:RagB/SusD family nutrient uptake outer membrane protein [Bacteroidales bacterium]
MKKIYNIIVLFTFLAVLAGCEKGLDPVFYGSLNPTIFPSTVSEYKAYAMEAYIPFTLRWGWSDNNWYYTFFGPEDGIIQLFDAPTDLMPEFTSWGDGDVFWNAKSKGNFAPLVAQSRSRSHFEKVRIITRMTKTIDDLEKATVFSNEKERNQLIGEVKVARGWTMLNLLQLFGPVPVITDPAKIGDPVAEADLTRPARTDYVNWIISDLQFGADNLEKEAPEYGRFNKGLALSLLMRLYMNEKDFTNAETVGRQIKDLGYSLVETYESLFREATERNNETIYAVSCDPNSTGRGTDGNFNIFSKYIFPDSRSWGHVFAASWSFFDSFDALDTRRALLLDTLTSPDGTFHDRNDMIGAVLFKYQPIDNPGIDVPVVRYADIMLMLAEAINENNNGPTIEAITLVNDVRGRAKIGELSADDVASKEAFNNTILRERGWELYFEGLRLPDLVRHGKWPAAMEGIPGKTPGPAIYPLPQYAVLDGLVQNSEYQ